MRNISDKCCRENQNRFWVQYNFFPQNLTVYEVMWKNTVKPDRPQMTIWRMRVACWISKATHTNTHTLRIFNTYCFPAATMAVRTRLNNTLYLHCLYCLLQHFLLHFICLLMTTVGNPNAT